MADLTQNPEFLKFMQQYSGGQKAQPTTPQFVPQVPQAQPTAQDGRITSAPELADFMAGLNEQAGLPRTQAPSPMPRTPQTPVAPQVGPTVANAPFDPLSFFSDRAAGATAPVVDAQPSSPFIANPALEGMDPDFARQMNVPSEILTRPEAPIATSTTGQVPTPQTPPTDFTRGEVSPIVGRSPEERVGAGVFTAPQSQSPAPIDTNTGVGPMALGTPTSGSGIGTSVVNDVNFLQEGLKQAQPQTPNFQGLTTQGGQPLSEFLAGGTQLDAQGRMIDPNADRSGYEEAVADRAAGTFSPPGAGQAISDRDRRMASGEGTSTADLTDMAKANARGASASDVARGQQVADALGVDLKTGQPLAAQGRVSAKERAETGKIQAETAKIYNDLENPPQQRSVGQEAVDKALGEEYSKWGSNEVNRLAALNSIKSVADSIRSSAVTTGNWMEHLPVVNERFRNIFNPSGSDAIDRVRGVAFQSLRETLGAQFTEKESENLVKTYFNPTLGPEANLKRLDEFTTKLEAAYQAKSEMMEYFGKNKTERGFQSTGKSKDIMNSLLNSSSASGRSNGAGGGTEVGSQGLVIEELTEG